MYGVGLVAVWAKRALLLLEHERRSMGLKFKSPATDCKKEDGPRWGGQRAQTRTCPFACLYYDRYVLSIPWLLLYFVSRVSRGGIGCFA